ncbi:MAG: signal peptidase I [Clostridiales bacterium]|nr:signal peptidase I [Clostridiales bacterium]
MMLIDKIKKNTRQETTAANEKKMNIWPVLFRMVITFLVASFILFFVIPIGRISSGSMEPTLMVNDIGICYGLAYLNQEPQRGDVVIFTQTNAGDDETWIKRIVGIPGDYIQFLDGYVYIDGKLLEESYLGADMRTFCDRDFEVPENAYFVLGDNRINSWDSRWWEQPYVLEEDIKGKLVASIPLSKLIDAIKENILNIHQNDCHKF